jgi:hypothetical protein
MQNAQGGYKEVKEVGSWEWDTFGVDAVVDGDVGYQGITHIIISGGNITKRNVVFLVPRWQGVLASAVTTVSSLIDTIGHGGRGRRQERWIMR